VNPEKTKYMLVSRCQKAVQMQSIEIGNRSIESVAKLKYLGITLYPIDPWFETKSRHFSSILMNWEFGTLIQFIY
jgi:hypothetical protein